MQLGLKLGSKDTIYTENINLLYKEGYFQYIELFAVPGSFYDTIEYWRHFKIPYVIHAPHSFAGMNLSLSSEREDNKVKLMETFNFADKLNAEFIIFHSGTDGFIDETINQLRPFTDSRCLIENKPLKGINREHCIGSTLEEIKYICNELNAGFCFDFGHAICTANTLKKEPLDFIKEFMELSPKIFHFTDGDFSSETDTHYHYGKGSFPLKELFSMIPDDSMVTNEAKNNENLNNFRDDFIFLKTLQSKLKI